MPCRSKRACSIRLCNACSSKVGHGRLESIGNRLQSPGITVESYQNKEDDLGPDRDLAGRDFANTRIPILQGRDFGPQDRAHSPHVAIVNQTATLATFFSLPRGPHRSHWTLWRAGICNHQAHPRDWYPDGARRPAFSSRRLCYVRGCRARTDRHRARFTLRSSFGGLTRCGHE